MSKTIKQIIPMPEPGWTFKYVYLDGGKIHLGSQPVVAIVLLDVHDEDREVIGQRVEFAVCPALCGFSPVATEEPELSSESFSDAFNNVNEYPIGVCPPGASNSADAYPFECERLRKKVLEKKGQTIAAQ